MPSSIRRIAVIAVIAASTIAAAGCAPVLARTGDGFRLDDRPYTIAAAEDGRLMPAGWSATNLAMEAEDGDTLVAVGDELDGRHRLRKSQPGDPDLALRSVADDGQLTTIVREVAQGDEALTLPALVERELDRYRTEIREHGVNVGGFVFGWTVGPGPMQPVTGTFSGSGTVSEERAIDVRPIRAGAVEVRGGAGWETAFDRSPAGALAPDRRIYLAVLKPAAAPARGRPIYVVVAYTAAPSVFERGAGDAAALARRIGFATAPAQLAKQ